jgi:hypothetical protein
MTWYEAKTSVSTVTPIPVLAREGVPESLGGPLGPAPGDPPDHLPGIRVEGYPDPPHAPLVAHDTPPLVGLDYEPAGRSGSGPGWCGVSPRSRALTNPGSHDRDTPVTRAMARRLIRSARSRRTRSLARLVPILGGRPRRVTMGAADDLVALARGRPP